MTTTPHPAPPWEAPPPWALAQEQRNLASRWALGLGIASVVPGVALGAIAAGVLGVLRARRTGRGLVLSLVGLALAVAFLLTDVGLGVAAVVGVLPGQHAASSGGGGGGGTDPDFLPDPSARDNADLSTTEQRFVDELDAVSYLNFDDDTLVAMGHAACRDFDAGRTPAQDSDRLYDRYGAGVGDAWDVQEAATAVFCPQHADLLVLPPSTSGA